MHQFRPLVKSGGFEQGFFGIAGDFDNDKVVRGVEIIFAGLVHDTEETDFVKGGRQNRVRFTQFQVVIVSSADAERDLCSVHLCYPAVNRGESRCR